MISVTSNAIIVLKRINQKNQQNSKKFSRKICNGGFLFTVYCKY